MNALCLIIACCLGTNAPLLEEGNPAAAGDPIIRPANAILNAQQSTLDGGGVSSEFAVPGIPSIESAVTAGDVHAGACGCSYCSGLGEFGSSGWAGNPYTKCSSCRRDGGMWPYDYRRAFDYPWYGPNYAWGSPFVPQAWWPEVEAMFGPGYPFNYANGAVDGTMSGGIDSHLVRPLDQGGLLPIASPPFPTPMPRKIIRID